MRVLLTIGPAAGILNHGLALAFLLAGKGHHITWLTAPSSRAHLTFIGNPFDTLYSPWHDIDFDRTKPGRKPHLQQLCDEEVVCQSSAVEAEVIRDTGADIVINKHYYSTRLTCDRLNIPYVMYYTDGPSYLTDRNPQAHVSNAQAHDAINQAADRLGQPRPSLPPPFCQTSSCLNIVRGTPRTAGLSDAQRRQLPDTVAFCGALTYDGPPEASPGIVAGLARRGRCVIYVTFGTIATSADTLNRVVDALGGLRGIDVLVSSFAIAARDIRPHANVTLVRYVPNDVAFRHCAVVVHHGGHGTTLGALSAGVYQIIIPDNAVSTAQGLHGDTMTSLGVGRRLPADFSPDQLKDAVLEGLGAAARDRTKAEAARLTRSSRHLQAALADRISALADGADATTRAIS